MQRFPSRTTTTPNCIVGNSVGAMFLSLLFEWTVQSTTGITKRKEVEALKRVQHQTLQQRSWHFSSFLSKHIHTLQCRCQRYHRLLWNKKNVLFCTCGYWLLFPECRRNLSRQHDVKYSLQNEFNWQYSQEKSMTTSHTAVVVQMTFQRRTTTLLSRQMDTMPFVTFCENQFCVKN